MPIFDTSTAIPLYLDVRDLRLVTAVAEAGNLSRASRLLHLTQSTLSHHLADLEGRLGGPVFHRFGRRLELTPLGHRFREAAVPLLTSLRALEDDLRLGDRADERVELRLSTECYTLYPWLAQVVSPFRRRWPNVRVHVVAEATRDPLDALERGALDLAVVSTTPVDRRFRSMAVFRDELIVVVPPNHPWVRRKHVEPTDFRDVHLLTYAPEPAESSFVRDTLLPAGVLPRAMSGVPLTEGLLELAKAGMGVAVIARWAAVAHLRNRTLRGIRVGRAGVFRVWNAVRLRQHPHAVALDQFAALMRQHGPDGAPEKRARRK